MRAATPSLVPIGYEDMRGGPDVGEQSADTFEIMDLPSHATKEEFMMMRKFFAMAVVAFAALAANTMSASAWECQGPAHVCGGGESVKSYKASKSAYKASKSSKSYASNSYSKKSKKSYDYADSGSSYSGKASYYWQPQRVASGGWFNPNAMTAAHKTLPFGTKVRVTRLDTGESVIVRINDRGPFKPGRVIDLSERAAEEIRMTGKGVMPVKLEVLGK